ncbi:MAG: heparan-alpha-glucosaminide N-acetyltransferase domain-containing protein [Saccharofermentanales bacterium]
MSSDVIQKRIPELDAVRGVALLLMVFHHTIFDLRYIFGLDCCAFQDAYWFIGLGRPLVIAIFLLVSGISTRFSRSNAKRGLRMAGFAIALSLISWALDHWLHFGIIYFNVLHVIATATLAFALLERFCATRTRLVARSIAIGAASLVAGALGRMLLPEVTRHLGIHILFGQRVTGYAMADSMALFPIVGFYFLGAALGHTVYDDERSLLRSDGAGVRWLRPFAWMGRHALWIYILHQPVIFGVLTLAMRWGWIG